MFFVCLFVCEFCSSTPIVQVQKKKQGWWLPWWFLFIGWILLFAMSALSTFFTLFYGFQYGRESSIQWVITLTLSLVQSIFILQPLKVRTRVITGVFFSGKIILRSWRLKGIAHPKMMKVTKGCQAPKMTKEHHKGPI